MNNTSTVQMPTQIDTSKQSGANVPAKGADGKQSKEGGFSKTLQMLQLLSGEIGGKAGESGKKRVNALKPDAKLTTEPAGNKKQQDGKNLPPSVVLLPLMQPMHSATAAEKPTAGVGAASGNLLPTLKNDPSHSSQHEMRNVMKLLTGGGSDKTSANTGEAKTWMSALAQSQAGVNPHDARTKDVAALLGSGASAATAATAGSAAASTLLAHVGSSTQSAGGAGQPQQPAQAPLSLTDPGFANAVGDRVAWMAGAGGNHMAQMQLNPRELGPMVVHVKVDGHHTEVLFQTQHAVVRDALEAALPRLREMLAQGGQQVSVNVQQQSGGWQGQSGQQGQHQAYQQTPHWVPAPQSWSGFSPVGADSAETATPLSRWYGLGSGTIDTYV